MKKVSGTPRRAERRGRSRPASPRPTDRSRRTARGTGGRPQGSRARSARGTGRRGAPSRSHSDWSTRVSPRHGVQSADQTFSTIGVPRSSPSAIVPSEEAGASFSLSCFGGAARVEHAKADVRRASRRRVPGAAGAGLDGSGRRGSAGRFACAVGSAPAGSLESPSSRSEASTIASATTGTMITAARAATRRLLIYAMPEHNLVENGIRTQVLCYDRASRAGVSFSREGFGLTVFRSAPRWQLLILTLAAALLVLPAAAQATPTFLSGDQHLGSGPGRLRAAGRGRPRRHRDRRLDAFRRHQLQDPVRRTARPTGAWSAPQTISDPGVSASGPSLAVDPSGNAVAVWTQSDGRASHHAAYQARRRLVRRAGWRLGRGPGRDRARRVDGQQPATRSSLGSARTARSSASKPRSAAPARAAVFGPISTCRQQGRTASSRRWPPGRTSTSTAWLSGPARTARTCACSPRGGADVTASRGRRARPRSVRARAGVQRVLGGNRSHGAPLAFPSCAPPVQSSSVLTMGARTRTAPPANFSGFVRYIAVAGNSATEADEADVSLVLSLADVRNKPALTDYVGSVYGGPSSRSPTRATPTESAGARHHSAHPVPVHGRLRVDHQRHDGLDLQRRTRPPTRSCRAPWSRAGGRSGSSARSR